MALTGTSTTKAKPAVSRNDLRLILDQLDSEWEQFKGEARPAQEQLLFTYFHACVRPALHWIGGDPYGFQFPESYQGERLARMCGYLRTLQNADPQQVREARELNLRGLRACWPAYRDLAYPDLPQDWAGSVSDWECPPFSWEAIETLWDGQNWTGEGEKARALFLPSFRYRESADFHLAALAVLFLNRQLRLNLTSLRPEETN